jgi:hypothetical protein
MKGHFVAGSDRATPLPTDALFFLGESSSFLLRHFQTVYL